MQRTSSEAGPEKVWLKQGSAQSATATFTYDYAGRKLTMNDPDMGAWSYAYDALGNLTRQQDARNQRICFYYDALNRLTGKHYRTDDSCPASPTLNVSYTYDGGTYGKGQRTGMSDNSTDSTAWTYDARGRMTSETKVISNNPFTTSWTYNSADLPLTMTYPDGEILTYQYLPQRLLDKVYSNRKPDGTIATYYLVQDTLYDAAGRVDRRDLGATSTTANPVLVSNYNYNPWTVDGGRMSDLQAGIYTDQDSLLDLRYDYDQVGNLSSILDVTNNSQKQCFNYDALNRLIKAAVGANENNCPGSVGNGEYADQTYGYDPSTGNLLNKTGVGTYTYPTGKHRVTSAGSLFTLIYDANGNMTTRTISGSTYTLGYDYENRLTSVSGTATATFTFDGDGNRVKSVVGATITLFVGSHYESSGGVVTKYYLAGGTRLAMRTGSTFYWLLSDHLGSTSKVATATGTLHSQQLYKAWGESRYTSGTLPTRYTYTGQYSYTSDFGLVFYGSRFYDPLLSRWASPDSIIPQNQGTQAWDRYAYVNNSPLNYTDPTGHMADDGCNTEGCSLSTRDKANENYNRMRQEQQLCQNGKSAYCSNYVEAIAFGAVGLVTAGAAGLVIDAVGGAVAGWFASGAAATATTAACMDGDCLNEIETVRDSVQKGITVSGRYPAYINVAKDVQGKIFSVPAEVWNKLSAAEQWALNQQFLDDAIASGDSFYLASKWADAPIGSFFRMELEYLFSKGYTLSLYQNYLIPPSNP